MFNCANIDQKIFYEGQWVSQSRLEKGSLNKLQGRLQELNKQKLQNFTGRLPPNYQKTLSPPHIQVLKIALLVGAVALIAFVSLKFIFNVNFGSLLSQGEDFFKTLNISYLATGAVGLSVCVGGTILVIHRAMYKNERLLNGSRGTFFGLRPHIQTTHLSDKDGGGIHVMSQGYVDLSTLDEKGSGKAYIYSYKEPIDHYLVSSVIVLVTPFYVVGAVAYNVLRAFVAPLYVLFRCTLDLCSSKVDQKEQQKFTVGDALEESAVSIWRAVRAPIYGMAYQFAALYSFIDPMGGRKLGSYIERDWNDGVYLNEGYWSVNGKMPLYQWEGGGRAGQLGKTGFFLAGCWQPTARLTYSEGKVTKCESMERCLDPRGLRHKNRRMWCEYSVVTEH